MTKSSTDLLGNRTHPVFERLGVLTRQLIDCQHQPSDVIHGQSERQPAPLTFHTRYITPQGGCPHCLKHFMLSETRDLLGGGLNGIIHTTLLKYTSNASNKMEVAP